MHLFAAATAGQSPLPPPCPHLLMLPRSGVITATATNPIWVVKTVMQLQQQQRPTPPSATSTPLSKRTPLPPLPPRASPSPLFSQSFRSLSSPPSALAASFHRPTSYSTTLAIFRAEGIKGFYRGLSASLLGVTEGTIQWSLYEQFKILAKRGQPEGEEGGWRVSAAAGGAKLVATMITYPHEVSSSLPLSRSCLTRICAGHSHSTTSTCPSELPTAIHRPPAVL